MNPAWNLGRLTLVTAGRPLVMGILNLTPDSFHPPSRRGTADGAVAAGLAMLDQGADLLDLGAESTRPGADPVDPREQTLRLLPVLRGLRARTDAPLSIDTTSAEAARAALDEGADSINDISAGTFDPQLIPLAAAAGCGLVLMHMQGTPRTMQQDPHYDDVVREVAAYLDDRATAAIAAGIDPARILVDPGIGFGKTTTHNLALLARLDRVATGHGLLVGASRKSFLRAFRGETSEDRLGGSLAAVAAAHRAGATVVRVHDVAATVQFLDVLAAVDASRA